jgi:hypothetical protein
MAAGPPNSHDTSMFMGYSIWIALFIFYLKRRRVMGNYNLNVKSGQKVLDVMVEGTFSQSDAIGFMESYNKQVSTINAKDYSIELDCTKLNVSSQDVLPMLEQCFLLYKETGFNKVIFKISKNPVLKMQLSRVGRNSGLQNYEIIEA